MSKHQEFKLLNENFNKWLNEESELDSFLQERINNKVARLNEGSINLGGTEGLTLQSDFLKWTSITGISTLAITQASLTAALFAGWEATLIMVGASLIPAISTMLPFLAVGGIAAYIKVPMFRKMVNWVFKKIGSKTLDSMKEAVTLTIDKMIEASGGELTKEKAGELYALIATQIVKNSEFRKKMLDMLKAMKNKESEKIALLSSELDDLVEKIIKTDILTSSGEPNRRAIMKITKEQLKKLIEEEMKGLPIKESEYPAWLKDRAAQLDAAKVSAQSAAASVQGAAQSAAASGAEKAFGMAVKAALKTGMDPKQMMAVIEIQARTAAGTHQMPDGSTVAPK